MLCSVLASAPVVFSDSELEVASDAVASPDVVATGMVSVDEVNVAVEESLSPEHRAELSCPGSMLFPLYA